MIQARTTTQVTPPDGESSARKQCLRLLLLTALVLQLTWMLNVYPHWRETNSTSRVYLTVAIVQHGTFQIDKCLATYGNTLDKAEYNQHFYSDKAPGTSFLFVPVTWVAAALAPDDPEHPDQRPTIDMRILFVALRMLCVSLPTIGFWWLTLPWFREWTGREDRALAVVAAGALGTNFCIYATQLFAHVPAAWFLFLAFLSVRRCWLQPASRSPFSPGFLGGVLAGVAFLNDYVVMLAVAALGIATFVPRYQWRQSLGYGLGLAPSIAIWLAYNWICFDHPLKTGFMYHSLPLYGKAYQAGFLGVQGVDPSSVLGMLFSPARGMCFLSPVLVLAPVGWWRQFRSGTHRGDAVCSAIVVAGLYCFAMTTIDWRGGWGIGTRYLVPAVPFLLVGVAGAVRSTAASNVASIVFGALAVVGVLLTALAAATVPLFPQDFDNPLFTLVWPLVREGYLGPHLATGLMGSWFGLLPYVAAVVVTLILVTSSGPARTAIGRIGAVCLSFALAAIVIAWQSGMPEPPAEQLARSVARTEVLARLGYFEAAADEMLGLSATPVSTATQPGVPSAP